MANLQLQLSFLEQQTEDDPVPVWTTLSNQQRSQAVRKLASVIAKLALAEHTSRRGAKENDDE